MSDDLVRRRTELKHVFPAREGEQLRARMRSLGAVFAARGGWVTTVYFDLPDRRYARAALARPADNLKIRLREYFTEDDRPCSPFAWMEIKEREGTRSRKCRFQLPKREVAAFLAGELDPAEILACQERGADLARALEAVQRIHDIAPGELSPVGAVRYLRASVQGGSPAARLTLDRRISYHLGPVALHGALDAAALGPPGWTDGAAVVEVKHAGAAPPAWCAGVVGDEPASDYSKFHHLARLALAEAAYVD